jgi:putative ABC transport system substrate-binding protein
MMAPPHGRSDEGRVDAPSVAARRGPGQGTAARAACPCNTSLMRRACRGGWGSAHNGRVAPPEVPAIALMHPTQVARAFDRPGWVYEEKYDGWRMLASKRGDEVRLVSRAGRDHTRRFPELVASIAALAPSTLILDGEVCIFDQRLISRFECLRARPRPRPPHRRSSWRSVASGLATAISGSSHSAPAAVPLAARRLAEGLKAWEQVVEGRVAKDPRSPYRGGRDPRVAQSEGGALPRGGARLGDQASGRPRLTPGSGWGRIEAPAASEDDAARRTTDPMDRAPFLGALAGGLLAAPLAAEVAAQQTESRPRLGMLLTGSPSNPRQPPEVDAFMEELRQLGWVEGKNLAVERRWADKPDSLRELASDLARSDVSVILTPGPAATRAAKDATSTIPIVMVAFTDPQRVGEASLAHPGGNLTGLTIGQPEAAFAKRLELFREAMPRLSRVAVLWTVTRVDMGPGIASMTAAAQILGLRLRHLRANSPGDLDGVFKTAKEVGAEGLLLVESPPGARKPRTHREA